MEKVNTILYVNTQTIDDKNVDASCTFKQPRGISNEDYTVFVNVDDTILWEGISLDSDNDIVAVTQILYTGDFNIFGKQNMKGNGEGIVSAIVENDTKDEMEIYTICFDVYNSGKLRGSYTIDPKLQVNP